MRTHDPYTALLEELIDVNDLDTEQLLRESLRETQVYVKELRLAYCNSPANVDYKCRHKRAAYLLAYYPHYIEGIYHVLCKMPKDLMRQFFGVKKLRACFLGSGPSPEVLGWLAYLNEYVSELDFAVGYLLDKYCESWYKGQEITRYHLAPVYWPSGKLVTIPLEFDLFSSPSNWDVFVKHAFALSKFFVMQNCLNDQIGIPELLNSFLDIFREVTPGSLFVLIDLKYPKVQEFMRNVELEVQEQKLGVVHYSVDNGLIDFQSNIKVPPIIFEELLTGENRLIPRKSTKLYASILRRIEMQEDEIPF